MRSDGSTPVRIPAPVQPRLPTVREALPDPHAGFNCKYLAAAAAHRRTKPQRSRNAPHSDIPTASLKACAQRIPHPCFSPGAPYNPHGSIQEHNKHTVTPQTTHPGSHATTHTAFEYWQ